MKLEPIPGKSEVLEDNARKFIADALPSAFLKAQGAKSYLLVTDWTVTDENSETKTVFKHPDGGEPQYLLISKITTNGSRTTDKQTISEKRYKELVASKVAHLEKKRSEFDYVQDGKAYKLKYDVFADGRPPILEVDAEENVRRAFDASKFPYKLTEVTGDIRYYGYRAAVT